MIQTSPSQKAQVAQLLRDRGDTGLTSLEAFKEIGTMRLAAYVQFLEEDGYVISSTDEKFPSGKWGSRYRLISEPTEPQPTKPATVQATLFQMSGDASRN